MIIVTFHRSAAKTRHEAIRISAIIDSSTRIGKEAKVAMEIAARNFNNTSMHDKIFLQFHDIREIPLQAAGSSPFYSPISLSLYIFKVHYPLMYAMFIACYNCK